jgi:hypothetical protein
MAGLPMTDEDIRKHHDLLGRVAQRAGVIADRLERLHLADVQENPLAIEARMLVVLLAQMQMMIASGQMRLATGMKLAETLMELTEACIDEREKQLEPHSNN